MYRLILIAAAFHASAAIGNDYILRIDSMEHAVEPGSETATREATVCSVEVFARPQHPFHGRVKFGAETVSVSGKLRASDNGKFVAEFQFQHSVETGKMFLSEDGMLKPDVEESVVQTAVSIAVGSSVDIGGLVVRDAETQQTRQGRYVVTLSKYEPPID